MGNQQCLVSGVNNQILGDIIKRLLIDNNINVLETPASIDQIFDEMGEDVAYLFIETSNKKLPEEYKEMFNINSNLIVIELLNNGESVCLYMDDLSEKMLDKIINLNRAVDN
jgi:hypothetical protein